MRRARVELSEVSGLLPLSRAARRSAKASPHSPAALRFLAQLEDECSTLKEAPLLLLLVYGVDGWA